MPTNPLPFSPSISESLSSSERVQLNNQIVDQLYARAPLGIGTSLVNGSIVAYIQSDVIPKPHVLIWLSCLIIINLLRGVLVYQYRTQSKIEHEHTPRWGAWFVTGNAFSGAVWGALAIFLYPPDSIPHQIFLALILGGMVAGATAVFSVSQNAFLAYSLPTVLPIAGRFFFQGGQLHVAMGIVSLIFLSLMLITMRRNHETFMGALRLQLENSHLIRHLSDERDKAEALNQKLTIENQHSLFMETELVKHRDRLESLVEERTAELRKAEVRFQFLATHIKDIIWMMKLDGSGFSYVSSAVERVLGYSVEETTTKLSLENFLTPDSLDAAKATMVEELAREHSGGADPFRSWTLELQHYCKDGSTIWAEVRGGFLRDERGAPLAFVGVTRDVTDRKRMDEEKQRLEEQLLRSQKMEAIGTLAGGIAHDFNNLLTGVLGNISLFKETFPADHPDLRFLRAAEQESNRAKVLAQQLLVFSKGGEPIKQLTSLQHLVKQSVDFALSGSAVTCRYEGDDPLWAVEVDTGQITQVVHHLVINALQAMPNGGTVTIKGKNLVIDELRDGDFPFLPSGCFVNVSFVDTGIGIAPDDVSKGV